MHSYLKTSTSRTALKTSSIVEFERAVIFPDFGFVIEAMKTTDQVM
jgi:hypothetical protein